jgi:hypothetical protein
LTRAEFEIVLAAATERLQEDVTSDHRYRGAREFEQRVRVVLREVAHQAQIPIDMAPPAQIFPDIVIDEFGVEVKVNSSDSWRCVANSVFEGTRHAGVRFIYILIGKMGGEPKVAWGRYEDCVMHVRTSHVPRFEVEINPQETLFQKMGIEYGVFSALEPMEKMRHVRAYARGRLRPGERLWWLEDKTDDEHTLPIEARLYKDLPDLEKIKLRAESALLCPAIVQHSRSKRKYDDVSLFLLTYHGVLASQARDLFSAGSVALAKDSTRGGNYLLRALINIQPQMRKAAEYLSDELFIEYWGVSVPPDHRIREWLIRADAAARDWRPSEHLFLD